MTEQAASDSNELSQEEVFNNDVDPLEGIAQLRKDQEKEVDSSEESQDVNDLDDDTANDKDDDDDLSETGSGDEEVKEGEDNQEDAYNDTVNTDEDDTSPKESEIKTFKANGQEFNFTENEMMEQFPSIFGQAMDYTQKMQAIKPYRKMISALESEGITQEQLNVAIDALKGNKGALQTLIKTHDIDTYDLDQEQEGSSPYSPGNYGKDEAALNLDEIIGSISNDQEFAITANVVEKQWDDASRQHFANNPAYIQGLHNDIKSGVFDKVAPAAMKMKVLDGNTKSDIEYYILAGQQHEELIQSASQNGQKTVDDLNKRTQDVVQDSGQASLEAQRKQAAAATAQRADRKGAIDYLADDDEAFDDWYKKLMANN